MYIKLSKNFVFLRHSISPFWFLLFLLSRVWNFVFLIYSVGWIINPTSRSSNYNQNHLKTTTTKRKYSHKKSVDWISDWESGWVVVITPFVHRLNPNNNNNNNNNLKLSKDINFGRWACTSKRTSNIIPWAFLSRER